MRLPVRIQIVVSLLIAAFCCAREIPARADVQLAPVFSDHMVLQREMSVPVWGTAAAGEEVTIKFRTQEKKTQAGEDGKWIIKLDPLTAGGPDEMMVNGKNSRTLADVLVGEVWVGSGQSNMQGNVGGYAKGDEVLAKLAASGPYPKLRLISNKQGGWKEATEPNINPFSALLFSFGQKLQQDLDVPVGLMQGAVGGTPSGAWLSEEALAADIRCQELIQKYAATYETLLKKYEEQLEAWPQAVEDAKKAGKNAPGKPGPPAKPGTANNQKPGYLYEPHIRHFVGYGIRGTLWDQGESGTQVGGVDQYTLMGALIRGWRKEWGQGDFAFIYVQKPSGEGIAWDNTNPVTAKGQPFTPAPAAVQNDGQNVETHVRIMNYPNTGMAISTDLGNGIHPSNKSGYGQRSAAVAEGMVYGKKVEYYGPLYASHAEEGNKIRIRYTHVGQGLAARPSDKLQGFAIAGEDKQFHWADAEIDGDTVVVSSPKVPKPVAVRYAYSSKRTHANLFNKDGLPAITFRTDTW